MEVKILHLLNNELDPSGDKHLVRMVDFFCYREHLFIVFELLSASLFDVLKETNFNGLSLNLSRVMISQILEAMRVVSKGNLIHCDLKPENILLKS